MLVRDVQSQDVAGETRTVSNIASVGEQELPIHVGLPEYVVEVGRTLYMVT